MAIKYRVNLVPLNKQRVGANIGIRFAVVMNAILAATEK